MEKKEKKKSLILPTNVVLKIAINHNQHEGKVFPIPKKQNKITTTTTTTKDQNQ